MTAGPPLPMLRPSASKTFSTTSTDRLATGLRRPGGMARQSLGRVARNSRSEVLGCRPPGRPKPRENATPPGPMQRYQLDVRLAVTLGGCAGVTAGDLARSIREDPERRPSNVLSLMRSLPYGQRT